MLIASMVLVLLTQGGGQGASPSIPAFAERLARATSLPDDQLVASFETNLPPARRRAMEAAIAESRSEVDGLRTALATVYARHLSPSEMEGAADFFESPVGASFEQKILRQQADRLSAEEVRAAQAFIRTPAGLAFRAKEHAIGQDLMPIVKAFGERLISRAQAIHCREAKECGPFMK